MDRLDELISIYLEGDLSKANAEFVRLLRADPSRRRAFIEEYRLEQLLQTFYQPAPADAAEKVIQRLTEENNPFVESVIRNIFGSPRAGQAPAGAAWCHRLIGHWPEWVQGAIVAAGALGLALMALGGWMLFPVNGRPEIGQVHGHLTLERGGRALTAPAGTRLQRGDALATGPDTAVILTFGREQTEFELGESTHLRFDPARWGKRFSLLGGRMEARVARQGAFRPLIISTPQAEVRVVGTRFRLAADEQSTTLDVREGKVRLTRGADGATAVVRSGMRALAGVRSRVVAVPAPGRVLAEIWTNYPGAFLEWISFEPEFRKQPNEQGYLTSFQSPLRTAPHVGERIRGYLQPAVTDKYRFWVKVSGPGEAHLFLSQNEDPANRRQIAEVDNSPNAGPALPPAEFPLVAGAQYYIEALHEGVSETQLTVLWERPGRVREVIPGEFLSPAPANLKK